MSAAGGGRRRRRSGWVEETLPPDVGVVRGPHARPLAEPVLFKRQAADGRRRPRGGPGRRPGRSRHQGVRQLEERASGALSGLGRKTLRGRDPEQASAAARAKTAVALAVARSGGFPMKAIARHPQLRARRPGGADQRGGAARDPIARPATPNCGALRPLSTPGRADGLPLDHRALNRQAEAEGVARVDQRVDRVTEQTGLLLAAPYLAWPPAAP